MENRHKRFEELRDHFTREPDGASFSPDQLLFSESQSIGSIPSLSGVTLNKRLNWSPHIEQVSRRTGQRMDLLVPLLNRRSDLSIRNGVLLYKQLIRPLMDYACPPGGPLPAHTSGSCRCCNPSVFALLRVPLGTLVTGRFTRIWVFLFRRPYQSPN